MNGNNDNNWKITFVFRELVEGPAEVERGGLEGGGDGEAGDLERSGRSTRALNPTLSPEGFLKTMPPLRPSKMSFTFFKSASILASKALGVSPSSSEIPIDFG